MKNNREGSHRTNSSHPQDDAKVQNEKQIIVVLNFFSIYDWEHAGLRQRNGDLPQFYYVVCGDFGGCRPFRSGLCRER
jgi:hypothetical protein